MLYNDGKRKFENSLEERRIHDIQGVSAFQGVMLFLI